MDRKKEKADRIYRMNRIEKKKPAGCAPLCL